MEVTKLLENKDKAKWQELPVVLICRSGKRTLEAGATLKEAGLICLNSSLL